MNGALKISKTAVLSRDRLPPVQVDYNLEWMANIGDYNTQFTFVYKDMVLYNWNKVIWRHENK